MPARRCSRPGRWAPCGTCRCGDQRPAQGQPHHLHRGPDRGAGEPAPRGSVHVLRALNCSFDAIRIRRSGRKVRLLRLDVRRRRHRHRTDAAHAFVNAGDYSVQLTVTDDQGSPAAVTHMVSPTAPPPNQPPVARFTSACTGLTCTFDATTSSDPEDVQVAGYSWNFGDGATATATASHTFAAPGTFSVTLVADADAAVRHHAGRHRRAGRVAVRVGLLRPHGPRGWGSADVGGAWSVLGSAAQFSVDPGVASLVLAWRVCSWRVWSVRRGRTLMCWRRCCGSGAAGWSVVCVGDGASGVGG